MTGHPEVSSGCRGNFRIADNPFVISGKHSLNLHRKSELGLDQKPMSVAMKVSKTISGSPRTRVLAASVAAPNCPETYPF